MRAEFHKKLIIGAQQYAGSRLSEEDFETLKKYYAVRDTLAWKKPMPEEIFYEYLGKLIDGLDVLDLVEAYRTEYKHINTAQFN